MEPAETDNPLKLGKGSRITIAIVSFVSALMILPIALDPPNELGIINFIPPVFCLLIVGACISPKKIRGYCGDIIAFFVIVLAIWFYVSTYPNGAWNESYRVCLNIWRWFSLLLVEKIWKVLYQEGSLTSSLNVFWP